MSKASTLIKFTYNDYRSLPELETQRYELLEGELVPMPPSPGFSHQFISIGLSSRLHQFVHEHHLGIVLEAPVDVVLGEPGEEQVVQPDILFISKTHSKRVHSDEIRGAPDLVVEILSPATAEKDYTYKRTLYAKYGVKEYWLVDPESQTIEVLALRARGYRRAGLYDQGQALESPILVGLRIPLKEVFAT